MKNSMVSLSVMVLVAVSRGFAGAGGRARRGWSFPKAGSSSTAATSRRRPAPRPRGSTPVPLPFPPRARSRRASPPSKPSPLPPRPAPRRLRVLGRVLHAPQDPQVGELPDAAALRDGGRARAEALQRHRHRLHAFRAPGRRSRSRQSLRGEHRDRRLEHGRGTKGPEPQDEGEGPRHPHARRRRGLRRERLHGTAHGARDEFESTSGVSPSTHRAIALSSMGVATVAYLIMLFGH